MGTSSSKIALIAAISTFWPGIALPQAGSVGAIQNPVTGTATTTGTATGTATGTTTGTAATAANTTTATAANRPGGLQVDVNVSSSLTVDDNFQLNPVSAGTSTISDNRVGVRMSSVTGVQDFNLTASGVFRFADIPGRTVSGFEDPTVQFSYALNGINSRLSINGRFRNVDREFLDPFQIEQEEQLSNVLIGDGGTLKIKNLGLTYQTGINAPIGFTLGLGHDEKTYSNVINPSLIDTENDTISGTVTMKVAPVATLRFGAAFDDFTAQDAVQTNRETLDYFVGGTYDINPVLQFDGQIGWTEVETNTINRTDTNSGANGSASLRQTLTNGTAFASIGSKVNQNGTTTTLRFGRDLQLPRGSFGVVVGGAKTPSGDTHVIGSLSYRHQMKTSDIAVSVNRTVSTNNQSQDVLDTRVGVSYGYLIDNISRLDFTLNWGQSESAGIGGAPTLERTSLRAAYSRSLTQDWNLTGGVVLRKRADSSVALDAESSSLFLTLGRNFNFRP